MVQLFSVQAILRRTAQRPETDGCYGPLALRPTYMETDKTETRDRREYGDVMHTTPPRGTNTEIYGTYNLLQNKCKRLEN